MVNKVLELDLSENDVLFYKKYSTSYSKAQKLYNKVSEMTGENVVRGRYNYASSVILFLKEKDKDTLGEISIKLQEHLMQIDDIFISFYTKSSNDDINFKAFCSELKIFKDRCVILYDIDIEHEEAIYAESIDDAINHIVKRVKGA